jgi:hypothetical protein
MLFEDKDGKLYTSNEIDYLPVWEIEVMGIHVFEEESEELFI